MSPPTALADYRMGGSTAPLRSELISAARLILDNCGIHFGTRKVFRLVDNFVAKAPHASGFVFFQYLANAVQMSEVQKRSALLNPDIARAISYSDPTGETAVNNVLRERRR